MHDIPVFCEVRYLLDPNRLEDFADYGRAWIQLIERHGGIHYGFFMPGPAPDDATISFPGIGETGPDNIAVALYGFANEAAYNNYRLQVGLDPEAARVIKHFSKPPFKSYERIFLTPLSSASQPLNETKRACTS